MIDLNFENDDSRLVVDNASLTFIDTTPPVITLNGPETLTLECAGDPYTEQGAQA
ncbi:MAG: DUF5011 domain-containing protein, partial [Akkermansiaceae bacterium]|nr:DUF5011 domain-containing protein [Akkermansiaceae bacterium]